MYTEFFLGVAVGFAGAVSTITIIGIIRTQKFNTIKYKKSNTPMEVDYDFEIPHYDPRNERW
ncbi:hypothetical protein [Ascidiimonas sp. W6]|uniref:hypothetical protein n=1 Tax=Ascidiimonas meishanensis TaxID=3128903 RepID=UPI0030EDBE1F